MAAFFKFEAIIGSVTQIGSTAGISAGDEAAATRGVESSCWTDSTRSVEEVSVVLSAEMTAGAVAES